MFRPKAKVQDQNDNEEMVEDVENDQENEGDTQGSRGNMMI